MAQKKNNKNNINKLAEIESLVTAISSGNNVKASKLLEKAIKTKVQNKIKSALDN